MIKNRKNTYEFSHREKRELLQRIIHTGGIECQKEIAELTPNGTLMPKTYYKRNMLIQELIESIGLTSKKLSQEQIDDFFADLSKLASPKSVIMSTDFDKMSIKLQHKTSKPQLTYPRERFTQDTYLQISKLPIIEQRKIYDYFAFEIEVGKKGLTLTGYPTNQNNAKKLASIKNAETRKTIEKLIPLVDKFTKENKITIEGNPQLETEMNKILKVFPEFATTIGKVQHETQDFTVDVHIMKVLQCVMRDPRFEKLSDKDKQILQLSTILHDLTKLEKSVDKTHPKESAFDAYYLLDRLNLPREDKLKAYEIIKNHDWLERINKKVYDSATNAYRHLTETEKEPIMREIAFAHRQNDCYEMAKILTKADLNGVKADSKFYDLFKNAYEENSAKVQNLIDKIKETAISIPQSKIPKASELIADGEIVKSVECDGITNKVIYLKPKQDLSKVGFNTGTTSDELNVIVHALDAEEQATVFKALGFVDSDALLSSSWINYQKGNYKVFRGQGFVLKVDSDDIHAGSYKDFGSGYKKDCDTLLRKYIFGNERSQYRKYWSDEVQKKFNLTKEEYLKFNDSIKNKSFEEIKAEQPQVAQKLQEIVDEMDVWRRKGDRNYNEWLISRPEIQAGFFWGKNPDGSQKSVANVPLFIREYCAKNDLPLIFFGD